MIILVRRVYLRDDCTRGFLRIYEGEEKEGGEYFCDTLEPHAIKWEVGLRRSTESLRRSTVNGQRSTESLQQSTECDVGSVKKIAGKTAIPEGRYEIELAFSKKYKRMMPLVKDVPGFKTVVIKTGTDVVKSRGDILVGDRTTFDRLFRLIECSMARGDTVTLIVRSVKKWEA